MSARPNPVGRPLRSQPASELRPRCKGMAAPDDSPRCPVRGQRVENPRFEGSDRKHNRNRNDEQCGGELHSPMSVPPNGWVAKTSLCELSPGEIPVGVPGFEPGTSCPPDKRANQAAPHPVYTSTLSPPGVSGRPSESGGLLGGIASDASAGCGPIAAGAVFYRLMTSAEQPATRAAKTSSLSMPRSEG